MQPTWYSLPSLLRGYSGDCALHTEPLNPFVSLIAAETVRTVPLLPTAFYDGGDVRGRKNTAGSACIYRGWGRLCAVPSRRQPCTAAQPPSVGQASPRLLLEGNIWWRNETYI